MPQKSHTENFYLNTPVISKHFEDCTMKGYGKIIIYIYTDIEATRKVYRASTSDEIQLILP